MTRPRDILKRSLTLAALLVSALALPASSSAFPTAESDGDLDVPRRVDTPSVSSIWDAPAPPTPVVVRAPRLPPGVPALVQSANPLWAVPLAGLTNTRERPIFSASRRPPPPAVATLVVAKPPPPPPPPRVERPQLSLVGTIAGGDESFGIFVDQTTKSALRLKLGEDYQGWRLRVVQGRDVTLQRDQQTAILSMPQPGATVTGMVRVEADRSAALRRVDAPSRGGGRRR